MKHFWWCPECNQKVEGKDVTYTEQHIECGERVVPMNEKEYKAMIQADKREKRNV